MMIGIPAKMHYLTIATSLETQCTVNHLVNCDSIYNQWIGEEYKATSIDQIEQGYLQTKIHILITTYVS